MQNHVGSIAVHSKIWPGINSPGPNHPRRNRSVQFGWAIFSPDSFASSKTSTKLGVGEMARIRTVKPELWTDEKFVTMSFEARLLFIGLWNFADDDGRLWYEPLRIKMQVFPAENVNVEPWLSEIKETGLIKIYKVEGKSVILICGFKKHQRINRPSTSCIPPEIPEVNKIPHTPFTEDSVSPHGAFTEGMEGSSSSSGREGKGKEVVVENKIKVFEARFNQKDVDRYYKVLEEVLGKDRISPKLKNAIPQMIISFGTFDCFKNKVEELWNTKAVDQAKDPHGFRRYFAKSILNEIGATNG